MDTAAFLTALATVSAWLLAGAVIIALVSGCSLAGTAAYAVVQRLRGRAPAHIMAWSWKELLFTSVFGGVFACLAGFLVVSAATDLLSNPVGWRSLLHLFWVVAPLLSVWHGWRRQRAEFARMERDDPTPGLAA